MSARPLPTLLASPFTQQVAGETEVKAQIKLRFITATRQPVVIIRSFQLTQASAGVGAGSLQVTDPAGHLRL